MKKITLLLLVTCYLLLVTDKAEASALSIGIYPPILQIEATPPASIKAPITIENLGDATLRLSIVFKPFTAAPSEDGQVKYLEESQGLSGPDPLIFQRMQILDNDRSVKIVTLAPKQQKQLTLHIGIPQDEPASDYYFSIIFATSNVASDLPDQPDQTNLTTAAGAIATNVLLSIGPKGAAKGSIEEFSAPLFLEKGPVPFTLRVRNSGGHVIAPRGSIVIKNMFGQTVGKVDLLPVNILSSTIRAIPDSLESPDSTPSANTKYPSTLSSGPKGQILNTKYPTTFWHESFLLGPYTASLKLSLSDEGPVFTRSIRFFALPVQAIIGLIMAILVILIIRNRLKNHV